MAFLEVVTPLLVMIGLLSFLIFILKIVESWDKIADRIERKLFQLQHRGKTTPRHGAMPEPRPPAAPASRFRLGAVVLNDGAYWRVTHAENDHHPDSPLAELGPRKQWQIIDQTPRRGRHS